MSIPVALDELRSTSGGYRFAYLMTIADDGRPHAVAVSPTHDGAVLVVAGVGRRTAANAEARPVVALVWPPDDLGGYSLIVDGDATVDRSGSGSGNGDGTTVRVRPTKAVLHRPAPSPDPTSSCTSDCRSVPLD
jgi:hypothetical protein